MSAPGRQEKASVGDIQGTGPAMSWQIDILEEARTFQVAPGCSAEIKLQGGREPLAIAVSPGQDDAALALVIGQAAEATVGGRPTICPVIPVGRRGLALGMRQSGVAVHVHIHRAWSARSLGGGRCALCRMRLEDSSATRECPCCVRTYHAECLCGEQKCPACGGALAVR